MNMSCVHPTVCGDCQVSTNTVSSGRVQLTTVCTNPKCLSFSVGLRSRALLCKTPAKGYESTTCSRKSYLHVVNSTYRSMSTISRVLGSSVFPLYMKKQPPEHRLCSHIRPDITYRRSGYFQGSCNPQKCNKPLFNNE